MSDEQTRKVVEEYMNAWSKGDASKLQGILDNSFTFNPPPGFTGDKEGGIEMARQYHTAFPDMRMTYSNWVIQGDNVAVRIVASGTHKGEFMGIPATNKKADVTGLSIVKLRNGKVVNDISEFDQLTLLTKIGAIPPLGESAGTSLGESAESSREGFSSSRPARVRPTGNQRERDMETPGDL